MDNFEIKLCILNFRLGTSDCDNLSVFKSHKKDNQKN